jgi:hypothetical protein
MYVGSYGAEGFRNEADWRRHEAEKAIELRMETGAWPPERKINPGGRWHAQNSLQVGPVPAEIKGRRHGYWLLNESGKYLCYDFKGFHFGDDPEYRILYPTLKDVEHHIEWRLKTGRWPKPTGGIHQGQETRYSR